MTVLEGLKPEKVFYFFKISIEKLGGLQYTKGN